MTPVLGPVVCARVALPTGLCAIPDERGHVRASSSTLGRVLSYLAPALSLVLSLAGPHDGGIQGKFETASSPDPDATEQAGPAITSTRLVPTQPKRGWMQGCRGRQDQPRQGCTRSPVARTILGISGILIAGTGSALMLLVGDGLSAGDPGAMMMGVGAIAIGGATLGAVAGLRNGDRIAPPDRVRPSTIGLEGVAGDSPVLGEQAPGAVNLRVAPTWYFPNGDGRLRLLGRVGGMLGPRVDVDPRAEELEAFDDALSERSWSMDVALDLAVALPYPATYGKHASRGAHGSLPTRGYLGGWELRYKPSLSMRRERYQPAGGYEERRIERLMLLPLTVGGRWHLSSRQRFTFYAGPRFDYVSFALADAALERGPATVGSFYGEAWWDLDFPHLLRGPAATRYSLRGQLTAGYVHTRFDGQGANLGTAIGFMGPYNFAWRMRLRKLERSTAFQFGVGAWVGNGVGTLLELGISLPGVGSSPERPQAGTN